MRKLTPCRLVFAASLLFNFNVQADEIWTASLGTCQQTGGNGTIKASDKLAYNRITVLEDAEKAVVFKCLIDLRSDKAITKVQVDFIADSANTVKDNPPDHQDMPYYLPSCALTIHYNPGGSDVIDLIAAKSVPWGNYDRLIVTDPEVQHAGNGYAQSALLQCQTPYYGDTIRFYGMRISYAETVQ